MYRIHASLRPTEAYQYERWMEMNESSIIGGTKYWYDTKHHTSSWKPPSKKDIDNHIQQFQQQEEQEHKSDGKYLSEGAARE